MRPTTWRRSTHIVIGVAVVLVVAAVVVAAALLRGNSERCRRDPCGACARGGGSGNQAGVRFGGQAHTGQVGRNACVDARRSEPRRVHRPDRRCRHRRTTLGPRRRPADATRLGDQGADHRGGTARARPRPPSHHHCGGVGPAPRPRRAQGRRRPDVVGRAEGNRHLVPRRGSHQRPRRPGAPQRCQGDHGGRRRQRLQRADDGAGLGSPRHRRRRHRPDGSGDARRRTHPAGQRRVAPFHHPGARRRSRACRGAACRSRPP